MLMLEYLRGMGMALKHQPDVWGRSGKKLQITNFYRPNNVSFMTHALKSVPGLADVGVPHGDEDGPRTLAPGSGSKIRANHVDQCEKLKRWGRSKATYRLNWP